MSQGVIRTVLAPDAPWPSRPAEKPKPKKRVPPPPKDPSKIKKTDAMFELWASKNIGAKP